MSNQKLKVIDLFPKLTNTLVPLSSLALLHSHPLTLSLRKVTLRLRSVRPMLRMDTVQVRGGGQEGDGTRTRASNNLKIHMT